MQEHLELYCSHFIQWGEYTFDAEDGSVVHSGLLGETIGYLILSYLEVGLNIGGYMGHAQGFDILMTNNNLLNE